MTKVIEIIREAGSLMQNRDFEVASRSVSDNVTTVDFAGTGVFKKPACSFDRRMCICWRRKL